MSMCGGYRGEGYLYFGYSDQSGCSIQHNASYIPVPARPTVGSSKFVQLSTENTPKTTDSWLTIYGFVVRAKNDCKTAECDEDLNIPGQHSLNQPNSLNNTPCQKGCDPTYITWGRSVLLRSLRRASGFVLGVSCFSLIPVSYTHLRAHRDS